MTTATIAPTAIRLEDIVRDPDDVKHLYWAFDDTRTCCGIPDAEVDRCGCYGAPWRRAAVCRRCGKTICPACRDA